MARTAKAERVAERAKATYDEVLRAPENMVAEIIDGELVLSPRPASPHGHAGTMMTVDLAGPFARRPGGSEPGGWWILVEPELHLGKQVLVPDLAGWRRERLPTMPAVPWFELPPDWVCEIISPSSVARDRMQKMRIYARSGLPHAWLVDPLAQLLEVFRLVDGHWLVVDSFAGEMKVRAEPFDAVELELARWWLPGEEAAGEEARGEAGPAGEALEAGEEVGGASEERGEEGASQGQQGTGERG